MKKTSSGRLELPGALLPLVGAGWKALLQSAQHWPSRGGAWGPEMKGGRRPPLTFLGWLLVVAQLPAHVLQALLQLFLLFLSHLLLRLGRRLLLPTRGCGEESGRAQTGGEPGPQFPGRARAGMAHRAASDGRLTRCRRCMRRWAEGDSGPWSRRPGLSFPPCDKARATRELRRGGGPAQGRDPSDRSPSGSAGLPGAFQRPSPSSQQEIRRGWNPIPPPSTGVNGKGHPLHKRIQITEPPSPHGTHPAKREVPFPQGWLLLERNFPKIRAAAALLLPSPATGRALPSSQAGPHPQPHSPRLQGHRVR